MKRTKTSLAIRVGQAALIAMAFTPIGLLPATPALAASPAQEYCENVLGGVYDKQNGQITCTVTNTDTTGANGHGQPITTTVFVFTNGTWNNVPQAGGSSSCSGPGNSGDNSDHCN
jgi:hypothetical protein